MIGLKQTMKRRFKKLKHHFWGLATEVVQSANTCHDGIKGWQTYSRFRQEIPLDYSQWIEGILILIEVSDGVDVTENH